VIRVLVITVVLVAVVLLANLDSYSQVSGNKNDAPEVDFSRFPIVESTSSEPADPTIRAKLAIRGRKYNTRYAPILNEESNGTFVVNDSLSDLSALPVDKSSAVVVGEVTDRKAHLSEDKTAIYSEFEIRIQSILKNDSKIVLSHTGSVTVERYGGRIRFPSGKTVICAIDHQDMPQVGSRYVLFLSNDFPLGGHSDEDFYILMGYELRDGKVFPLDKTYPKHPISAYAGTEESTLFASLSSALANGRPALPR
jgi:hypothetical protein